MDADASALALKYRSTTLSLLMPDARACAVLLLETPEV
jgi:hypothetical protein